MVLKNLAYLMGGADKDAGDSDGLPLVMGDTPTAPIVDCKCPPQDNTYFYLSIFLGLVALLVIIYVCYLMFMKEPECPTVPPCPTCPECPTNAPCPTCASVQRVATATTTRPAAATTAAPAATTTRPAATTAAPAATTAAPAATTAAPAATTTRPA
jgi:hypothetical protein